MYVTKGNRVPIETRRRKRSFMLRVAHLDFFWVWKSGRRGSLFAWFRDSCPGFRSLNRTQVGLGSIKHADLVATTWQFSKSRASFLPQDGMSLRKSHALVLGPLVTGTYIGPEKLCYVHSAI